MDEILKLLAAQILDFDCPECAKMDRCIDSLYCRLYAAGREDAADLVLAQLAAHSTEIKGVATLYSALLAVAELHKPTKNRSIEGWCDVCTDYYQYPCPTIQAIEKELAHSLLG